MAFGRKAEETKEAMTADEYLTFAQDELAASAQLKTGVINERATMSAAMHAQRATAAATIALAMTRAAAPA